MIKIGLDRLAGPRPRTTWRSLTADSRHAWTQLHLRRAVSTYELHSENDLELCALGCNLRLVEIVIVKAEDPGADDRTFLTRDDETQRAAIHVIHDLPHLVVETLFDLHGGLWGELAAGKHQQSNLATTARHPKRRKQGRIVAGGGKGSTTDEWLSASHRLAKAATNAVVNRWNDGPDTPAGVRARLAREADPAVNDLLARLDDGTIDAAIRGVRRIYSLWTGTQPGATLRLDWPLSESLLSETRRNADP
jgi:hypothetical protein